MKYEIYEIEDIITKVREKHDIDGLKFIKELKNLINSDCNIVDVRLDRYKMVDDMIINSLNIDIPHECQYVWIIVRQ